jgi:hypothetical protein
MGIGTRASVKRLQSETRLFGRESNVLTYWVARAEGFDVASRRRRCGRVERVLVDPSSGRAEVLVIRPSPRLPRRTRRLLTADEVVAVDPFARRLHLTHPRKRARVTGAPARSFGSAGPARFRAVGAGIASYAYSGWKAVVCVGRALWAGLVATDAWLGPRVVTWERSASTTMSRVTSRSTSIARDRLASISERLTRI